MLNCTVSDILYVTCVINNDLTSHLMTVSVMPVKPVYFLVWNCMSQTLVTEQKTGLWFGWECTRTYIMHAYQVSVSSCMMCGSYCMCVHDHCGNEGKHPDCNKSVCVIYINFTLYSFIMSVNVFWDITLCHWMRAVCDFLLHCLTLKMEALSSFKTLATTHPLTQHHIPVDLDPHQDHCENLKSRMSCYTSQQYYALIQELSCQVHEAHVLCVIMAMSHVLFVEVRHRCL